MNTETNFCLRVDVDTFEGLKKGIPRIVALAEKYEIPLTIYLSLGKYATGRNIFRKVRNREKVEFRIPPWKRNDFKSLLRGIILPVGKIRSKEKSYLQTLEEEEKLEIHPHGYNHVNWSAKFHKLSNEETKKSINNIIAEYESIFSKKPISNAAPNFNVNKHYFQILADNGFKFAADFKYSNAFNLQLESNGSKITQLPVTEPTIEDLIYMGKSQNQIRTELKGRFKDYVENEANYVCFYIHAIYEPVRLEKTLENIFSFTNKIDMKAVTHSAYQNECSNLPTISIDTLLS